MSAALPTRMRQVVMRSPGGPEVLELAEAPVPQPGPGELLVRVVAAGVNRPDVVQRQGHYPPPADASPILGLEVSGTVAALGAGVDGFVLGDAVCALANGGGYAEYCAVPAGQCLPVPQGVSLADAAGIPESWFTVWANVFQRAGLKAGDWLLVHGGASGIGSAAIQLGRAFGAMVVVTAGTSDKCHWCVELGAAHAIDYRQQDFVEAIRALRGRDGVDIILDMVGGDYVQRNLRCLAVDGRLVQIAFQAGSKVQLDLLPLMLKRQTLTGSTLRARSRADKARIASELRAQVWPLFAQGLLRVPVHARFPLAQAAAAHRLLEAGTHSGKLLLDVG